jgi:sterol desaturase/sphingolipid hydroxylase (fatty acid hydroxylase superfamily)
MTPRLHGIHHSVVQRETDSNFGVVLMAWDFLHCTRRFDVPQQTITIGVPAYLDPAAQTVGQLLALPLEPQRPWARPDGSVPAPHPASLPQGELAE